MSFCVRCGKDTQHLVLTENKGRYQYQYEECSDCGKQTLTNTVEIPEKEAKYFK